MGAPTLHIWHGRRRCPPPQPAEVVCRPIPGGARRTRCGRRPQHRVPRLTRHSAARAPLRSRASPPRRGPSETCMELTSRHCNGHPHTQLRDTLGLMWRLSDQRVEGSGRARLWGAEVGGVRMGAKAGGEWGWGGEGDHEQAWGVLEGPIHLAHVWHRTLQRPHLISSTPRGSRPISTPFPPPLSPPPDLHDFSPPASLPPPPHSPRPPQTSSPPSPSLTKWIKPRTPCGLTPLPVTRGTMCAPVETRPCTVTPHSAPGRGRQWGRVDHLHVTARVGRVRVDHVRARQHRFHFIMKRNELPTRGGL